MNEDLISRSALRVEMEAYVLPILANNLMGATDVYYRTLHLLDEAPAVDAETIFKQIGLVKEAFEMAKADLVAVVRCKDCKHRDPEDKRCEHYMVGFVPFPRRDNDFCSYGERRANKAVDLDIAASITDLDLEHMTRISMQQALLRK